MHVFRRNGKVFLSLSEQDNEVIDVSLLRANRLVVK